MSELEKLAATLADWSQHTSAVIYLFGSRARGDHTPDSDVDVVIKFPRVEDGDADWWLASNQEEFASINALLPGPLKILENDDPLSDKVVEAAKNPAYRDRNIICVWLPPKIN